MSYFEPLPPEEIVPELFALLNIIITVLTVLVILLFTAAILITACTVIAVHKEMRYRISKQALDTYRQVSIGIKYDPTDNEYAESLRFARLTTYEKSVMLTSLRTSGRFPATAAEAACPFADSIQNSNVFGGEHSAPGEKCTCGFYSHHDFEVLTELVRNIQANWCLLHVRLGGRTIEGAMGNRSQFQDTLRVWLPSQCGSCNKPAVAMVEREKFSERIIYGGLQPACRKHVSPRKSWTAEQLSEELGVPVIWAMSPEDELEELIRS